MEPIDKIFSLARQEKDIFDQLINKELQEIVKEMKKHESGIKTINIELGKFRRGCSQIAHDMETAGLKGVCKKESDFKFRYKLEKRFKLLKYYLIRIKPSINRRAASL